jgi:hypothetical protein
MLGSNVCSGESPFPSFAEIIYAQEIQNDEGLELLHISLGVDVRGAVARIKASGTNRDCPKPNLSSFQHLQQHQGRP